MNDLWRLAVRLGATLRDAALSDAFCGLVVIILVIWVAFCIVAGLAAALARRAG